MIEQLFFIVVSVCLFGTIFYQMIRENETGYLVFLILQALGIVIDAIGLIFSFKLNIFIKTIIYIFSIILPISIYILKYKNINIINILKLTVSKIYLALGNNKKAKNILLSIIEKNQNNYNAHKMLAEIYELEGGLRKTIDEYVICIDINKKDYNSYYKVATLLSELEKKDEAIEMLTSLLEKKPDYYDASITLGDLLIEKQNYKEALSILIDATKYNPLSFDLNYELGIVYTMLNDFKSAKDYYEKAAELNSLKYNAKYNLAQIALLYKDLELAEQYFEQTLEDEELSADSYYELAKIKLMKREKEIAIKYANIAIELDSKKIAEKIKNEPLFIPILTKISIPFNLEEKEKHLSQMDNLAKEHLENTSNITTNMGYTNFKKQEKNEQEKDNPIELSKN